MSRKKMQQECRWQRMRLWAVTGICLLASAMPPFAWSNGVKPDVPARHDPELMLNEVYAALSENRLREAQARADELVAAYPNFRLGHLVRGDLLLLHTQTIPAFGAVEGASRENMSALRAEAIVRLKSLRERPDPALVRQA